jgi:hypothetical protein
MRRITSSVICLLVCLLTAATAARASPLSDAESRNGLWFSLTAYVAWEPSGHGFGVLAAVGLPLDRMASKSAAAAPTAMADPPVSLPRRSPMPSAAAILVTPAVARQAVAAAWRWSGLADDGRLASVATRARASAVLPEIHLRVLRSAHDAAAPGDYSASSGLYSGNRTLLEARALFKLDRLLFADEEVAVERLRSERLNERLRLANHTLEALSKWQRARVESATAPAESPERIEADLRVIEGAGALDVLTGGWFSLWFARQSGGDASAASP